MNEIERMEDQLRRSMEGEAWYGPALNELVSDLTAEEAAAKPVFKTHSIWQIVLHITSTQELVCERLQGRPAAYTDEQDWPRVRGKTNAAWASTLRSLRNANKNLRQTVLQIDPARLDQPVVEGFSSVYATVHGAVQHNLYHAGQIALLKKAIRVASIGRQINALARR